LHKHVILKHEINALPIKSFTGAIHLIDSDAKIVTAAHALGKEEALGFDTETRPAFKKGESYPPSLVQLAASHGVYIFQLRHIRDYGLLAGILAAAKPLKAGVAVADDLKKLAGVFPFKPSGFIDLAHLAAKAGIKNAGVRGLAALLFGYRISKQSKISRWDAPSLTHTQIAYAATDAWICREIYFTLQSIRRSTGNKKEIRGRSCGGHTSVYLGSGRTVAHL